MQLSLTTDYAIRIMIYLLEKGEIIRSQKLSEELGISKNYIFKVTKKLERAGLVNLYAGVNGGVVAAKSAIYGCSGTAGRCRASWLPG